MAGVAGSAASGRASQRAASSACTPTRPRRSRQSTPARTSSSSRRPRRARRSATRCRSSRRSPTTRQSRALFLFPTKALGQDQVAEFSELSRAAGMSISAATYDGDTPAPIRSAVRKAGQVVVTQPGHAQLRDPPPPHEVVPAVRAAPGDRHRRAAHLPRRVRQPRRERHPAAAPPVRPLRQHAGHRLLLGDDREPRGARRDAHGTAVAADQSDRGAGRRAPRAAGRPADHRRVDRRPRLGPHAREPLGAAVPAGGPPDDRLRARPDGGRDPADRAARGAPRGVRAAVAGPRLSRRLPADGAAGDRARPAGRRDPRRRRDERAGARRGHRPARRVDPGRLPGLGRRDVAAVRAGRAGATRPRSRSSSPRPRRSTSTSSTTRSSCSTGRRRRPGSIRTTSTSSSPTSGRPRSRCRSSRARCSVRARPTTCWRSSRESGHVRQAGDGSWYWSSENFPASEISMRTAAPGERRDHRHEPGPAAGPRRGRPVQRPGPRPRPRDLHPRVGPVPRRQARLGRAQGVRPQDRRRPLHVRQPGGDAEAARRLRRGARRRRAGGSTAR